MTKDSTYIKKYVFEKTTTPGSEKNKDQGKQKKKEEHSYFGMMKESQRQKQFARTT